MLGIRLPLGTSRRREKGIFQPYPSVVEREIVRSVPSKMSDVALASSPALAPLPTLQIGMGWFPEQPGGLNRYFFEALRHLPRAGVPVVGMVAGSSSAVEAAEGKVIAFAPASVSLHVRWRGAKQTFAQLSDVTPESLAVSHFAPYTYPLLRAFKGGDRPLVVHFHGPWALESMVEGGKFATTWVKKQLERAVYRKATRVVALSQVFAKIIEEVYGYPGDRIRVVPGGVDSKRFAAGGTGASSIADARKRLDWPEGRPVVLAVRRLVRRMGLEELISAAGLVRRQIPDALFVIAGKGPLSQELASRITESGLDGYVRLQGYVSDDLLPWAYRAATLSVVPSNALEGFGLIVAESLAAGTPVLVNRVGGLPEVVQDLAPQLILPAGNPQVLAGTIVDALRGRLGLPDAATCRQFAADHYDWSVIAKRLRSVYAEAVA